MSDDFNPNDPAILHGAMTLMAWGLNLPIIEKMILIRTLHFTDPSGPLPALSPWSECSLKELSEDCSASVLLVSKAVSALEAKGLVKVTNMGRLIGGGPVPSDLLLLEPLFDGIKAQSIRERTERRDGLE